MRGKKRKKKQNEKKIGQGKGARRGEKWELNRDNLKEGVNYPERDKEKKK